MDKVLPGTSEWNGQIDGWADRQPKNIMPMEEHNIIQTVMWQCGQASYKVQEIQDFLAKYRKMQEACQNTGKYRNYRKIQGVMLYINVPSKL